MTYSELTDSGVLRLKEEGFTEARTDVRQILMYVGGMNLAELLFDGAKEVPKEQELHFWKLLEQRMRHMPVQYMTGEQEFCGLKFRIRPGVLIPRPETELLAEEVFKRSAGKRVLDLCTGSGCIAVTVSKLGAPEFTAASDVSETALRTAEENAALNGADITFFQGDLFETVTGEYDIIVSNPPYIKTGVINGLMPEVKEFEPHLALDGGEDGLVFYRRICKEAKKFLRQNGRLMFEIGHDQGREVSDLLESENYREIEIKKDYAGLDRMVFAVWPDKNKENKDV
ncbi:MAG: peptide chain release factor N(5)-glutamine methyltransferase [Lachnospiraceae bacterium]|nr:peptide chain release factor N(5)-glutamine methyltransferase [Lachnospiraceae bacterium]